VYAATVAEEGLPVLYELLRREGPQERVDVVLATAGGSVVAARQVALLLREYAASLTILVPWRARSAGTLLCLAADELVLAPLGHLSPIDPQIGGDMDVAPDLPSFVGAEDIRGFPEMAREWFGVQRDEDALQLLALVAQRIFPASLTAFHRSDRLVRRIADELLRLPAAAPAEQQRQVIVEALVSGQGTHLAAISRRDASALGLPVRLPEPDEETLLWEVWKACDATRHHGADGPFGLIAGQDFLALETRSWADGRERLDVEWEVRS
jgi:hypothetical protein